MSSGPLIVFMKNSIIGSLFEDFQDSVSVYTVFEHVTVTTSLLLVNWVAKMQAMWLLMTDALCREKRFFVVHLFWDVNVGRICDLPSWLVQQMWSASQPRVVLQACTGTTEWDIAVFCSDRRVLSLFCIFEINTLTLIKEG